MKDLGEQAFYRLLGARIRELRGGRLSQEQLAKKIGLKRTSIVNIEAGEQKLLVHNLFLIADALSMRASEIISPLEPAGNSLPSLPISEDISPDVDQWIKRGVSKAMRKTI
jgi:transcriptional regulator with XRE-family HTH domain